MLGEPFFHLDQWFLIGGSFACQGTFGNVWGHFRLSQLGEWCVCVCYRHQMGRGQGCCRADPVVPRTAPGDRELLSQPKVKSAWVKKPWRLVMSLKQMFLYVLLTLNSMVRWQSWIYFTFLFFNWSEIHVTHSHLKVNSSFAFSTFTRLHNHLLCLVLKYFHITLKGNWFPLSSYSPCPPSPATGSHQFAFCLYGFTSSGNFM